jgi:hypothetical protein
MTVVNANQVRNQKLFGLQIQKRNLVNQCGVPMGKS